MAANEHKNLKDINRHNPKGFETATNNTVLTKDIGSVSTLTDGNLEWQKKSLMGTTNYAMQGYLTGATNYYYGEDIADTKSPYEMAVDFGSATVAGTTMTVTNVFRVGQGCVIPEACSVSAIFGWLTSNDTNVVTLAVCKVTPTAGDSSNLQPVVIDEIAVTGLNNNNKLIAINETTITTASLAAGDIIFPMVKEASAGSSIYFNVNIQTTAF
tara:strand:- start:6561 stop:7199 length:639 start_codon:yes stop_codon:yes gene_type:complete